MFGKKLMLTAGSVILLCLIGVTAFAQQGMTLSEPEQNVIVQPESQSEEVATSVSSALGLSDFQDVIPVSEEPVVGAEEAEVPVSEIPMTETAVTEEIPIVEPSNVAVEAMMTQAPAIDKTTEWLWGEVINIDPEKKEVVVKHLDYETYEDANTTLLVNDKTTFENIEDLGKLKIGDHTSIDYTIENGANVAELIVVEGEEKVIEAGQERAAAVEEKVSAEAEVVPDEISVPAAEPQAVETSATETVTQATPETAPESTTEAVPSVDAAKATAGEQQDTSE
ncbi:MAG: hypothetical protein V1863_01515 [Candidatus Omnitrophota bacterium]